MRRINSIASSHNIAGSEQSSTHDSSLLRSPKFLYLILIFIYDHLLQVAAAAGATVKVTSKHSSGRYDASIALLRIQGFLTTFLLKQ